MQQQPFPVMGSTKGKRKKMEKQAAQSEFDILASAHSRLASQASKTQQAPQAFSQHSPKGFRQQVLKGVPQQPARAPSHAPKAVAQERAPKAPSYVPKGVAQQRAPKD